MGNCSIETPERESQMREISGTPAELASFLSCRKDIRRVFCLIRQDSQKASLSTGSDLRGKGYSSADVRVIEAAGKANLPRLTGWESEEMSSCYRKETAEGA